MKPAEDIRRLFDNAGLSTNADIHERVFADVRAAQERTLAESPARPERWRVVLRHPIAKYAAAAVVVVAVLTGFVLFHRTGSLTWAIEESIEVLGRYHALSAEGSASEHFLVESGAATPRAVRLWAVADPNQTTVEKYRLEMDGVTLLTTDGHQTWKYEPQAHRVTIRNRPYVASQYWLGRRFLEHVKEARASGILTEWQELPGADPAGGKPRITLRVAWRDARWNGPRSLQLEFDPQSKLLLAMRQWENVSWEGPAGLVIERVTYYESLPDELFQYQIPPGAHVQEQ